MEHSHDWPRNTEPSYKEMLHAAEHDDPLFSALLSKIEPQVGAVLEFQRSGISDDSEFELFQSQVKDVFLSLEKIVRERGFNLSTAKVLEMIKLYNPFVDAILKIGHRNANDDFVGIPTSGLDYSQTIAPIRAGWKRQVVRLLKIGFGMLIALQAVPDKRKRYLYYSKGWDMNTNPCGIFYWDDMEIWPGDEDGRNVIIFTPSDNYGEESLLGSEDNEPEEIFRGLRISAKANVLEGAQAGLEFSYDPDFQDLVSREEWVQYMKTWRPRFEEVFKEHMNEAEWEGATGYIPVMNSNKTTWSIVGSGTISMEKSDEGDEEEEDI